MPIDGSLPHTKKLGLRFLPIKACVARPVGKGDIPEQPKAREALQKEWDRLQMKTVWDLNPANVRDWSEVAAEAKTEMKYSLGCFSRYALRKVVKLRPSSENITAGLCSWGTKSRTKTGKQPCSMTLAPALHPWKQERLVTRSDPCQDTTRNRLMLSQPTSKHR